MECDEQPHGEAIHPYSASGENALKKVESDSRKAGS